MASFPGGNPDGSVPTPSHAPPTLTPFLTLPSSSLDTAHPLAAIRPRAEDKAIHDLDGFPLAPRKDHDTPSDPGIVANKNIPKGPDLIYRAICRQDGQGDKVFFSDSPFTGIEWGRMDGEIISDKGISEEDSDEESIVVSQVRINDQSTMPAIEIEIELFGRDVSGRPSHTRDGFRSKLDTDIEFGKDFIVQHVKRPTIYIYSRHLQRALRALVTYYPSQTLTGRTVIVNHPYSILMHYYHELQALKDTYTNSELTDDAYLQAHYQDKIRDEDTASDIKTLFKFLAPWYHQHIVPELQRHLQPQPVATFAMLWFLFKPGEDVYRKVNGKYMGYVIQSITYREKLREYDARIVSHKSRYNRWIVSVWNIGYTRQLLFRESHRYSIFEFQGEREITSLGIFPSKFLDRLDGNKTRSTLQIRGRRHYELIKRSPAHMGYAVTTDLNSPLVTNNILPSSIMT